jgi:hypothetical protein
MRREVILLQWRDLKIYGPMSRVSSRRSGVRKMEVRFKEMVRKTARSLESIVFSCSYEQCVMYVCSCKKSFSSL